MLNNFERIARLPPYVFAEVNNLKAKERLAGRDIIDLGMGNPDTKTPNHIVQKLIETAKNPKAHRYSVSRGIVGLRNAQAKYYERRFNVSIDPEKEIVVTLGSKEGLANLALAITTRNDIVIVPNPSYPIHPYGFIIAGAKVKSIPVLDKEEFIQCLNKYIIKFGNKIKAIVINYPNNPTANIVNLDFYEDVVKICLKNKIWILSDLAYSEIYFDNENPPPSILQVKNAKKIAIEFTSISKTYSMPGWRIGFACGNPVLVAALSKIKSYLDYGAFTPIQVAATSALNGSQDCIDNIRNIYRERRDVLVESMQRCGWDIPLPKATMFAWAPIPDKFIKKGSLYFAKLLLKKAALAVSPGIGFGSNGEGFVRISLVENKQRIRQAARNFKQNIKL